MFVSFTWYGKARQGKTGWAGQVNTLHSGFPGGKAGKVMVQVTVVQSDGECELEVCV